MMTLRQVEVIRAVMITGTIGGAAKLLNVSAPGISRLVKYTERSLGIRFFQRKTGGISRLPKRRAFLRRSTAPTRRRPRRAVRIADERAGLSEMKRNNLVFFAELAIEIDLLLGLEHPD